MSVIEGAKVVGGILRDNKDTIAHVGKVGVSEVVKHRGKVDAKQRYGDYLAFKSSGETDIEKFAYDRSQTSGRDWDEICENIRFHVSKNGGLTTEPTQGLPEVSTPTRRLSALELTHSKEFMNVAGMLELFDSVSLTPADISVMWQTIDNALVGALPTASGAWKELSSVFAQYTQSGQNFVDYFSRYSGTFRRVFDAVESQDTPPTVMRSAIDLPIAWKSVEIARFIRLPQNNGIHLTEEDWRQVHASTTVMLERRGATGDILGVWESLRDKWDMVSNPNQESIELVLHEVSTMQEIYNYVQIPSYGGSMESVVEEIFGMFPAMESDDFRKLDSKDGALLFACKKLKELI